MAITRYYQDNRDIRARFQTAFASANPSVRVIWENQPEDDGTDSPFPAIDEEYVKIVLRQNDSRQVSTGGTSRRFRHFGTAIIYIQTEAGKGTQRSEQIADLVGRSLGSMTLDGIVFRSPRFFQQGLSGRWFRSVVSVPYESSFLE